MLTKVGVQKGVDMDIEQIHKEFEKLSAEVGLPPEEMERLCAEALKSVGGLNLEGFTLHREAIKKSREQLKAKMEMGARRTNGTLQFPV